MGSQYDISTNASSNGENNISSQYSGPNSFSKREKAVRTLPF